MTAAAVRVAEVVAARVLERVAATAVAARVREAKEPSS